MSSNRLQLAGALLSRRHGATWIYRRAASGAGNWVDVGEEERGWKGQGQAKGADERSGCEVVNERGEDYTGAVYKVLEV